MTEMDAGEYTLLHDRLAAYADVGRLAEAEQLARQALTAHPQDPDLLGWLASLLNDLERHDEALPVADAALRLRPEDLRLYLIKKDALAGLDRYEEALAIMDTVMAWAPGDVDNIIDHASMLVLAGRREDGAAALRRAVAEHPDSAELHASLGAAEQTLLNLDAAERGFTAALRLDPGNGDNWRMLGLLHMAGNKVPQSLEAYGNAARCDPSLNVAFDLSWPIRYALYRSRWIQVLAVVLLALAPADGAWGLVLRCGAGLLAAGSAVDAAWWLVRGGRISWRAIALCPAVQLAVTGSSALLLTGVLAGIGLFAGFGGGLSALWILVPIVLLWILTVADEAFDPNDGEELGYGTRFLIGLLESTQAEAVAPWHRFRGLTARKSTTSP